MVSESAAVSPAAGDAVPGEGRLHIARVAGRSVVTRAYATSPLRLLTPSNHGSAAWVYTSSFGGGFVDGDRITMDVAVASGATAFLSTQASTKVYRSPHGTTATLRGRVESDALLLVVPDPVVCFAGARYRQHQRFDIAAGGGLLVLDWILAGRRAAGERWAFEEYHSVIEVVADGQLLLHDPVALRGLDGDLAARMGRFDVLAGVVVAGAPLGPDAAALIVRGSQDPVVRRADRLIAVSPLGRDGCILRIAGTSIAQVRQTVRELLGFISTHLHDDPWTRKW